MKNDQKKCGFTKEYEELKCITNILEVQENTEGLPIIKRSRDKEYTETSRWEFVPGQDGGTSPVWK